MILNVVGILLVLVKFLNASSPEAAKVVGITTEAVSEIPNETVTEDVTEIATPSVAKSDFIFAIQRRDYEAAKRVAADHPFLTAQFNADIFNEVLKCYAQNADHSICEPFYDLIASSFSELSKSKTTPMILAVFANSFHVFDKLIEDPFNLCALDSHGRTPLMYAARKNREYMMMKIVNYGLDKVENREELLNSRDINGKSLLHHVCESNQTDNDKAKWIRLLKDKGAKINSDLPYAANVWANELRQELVPFGAKVFHKDADKMLNMVLDLGFKASLGSALLMRKELLDSLIPFLFLLANSIPAQLVQLPFYYFEQLLLKGFDANLVLSYDTEQYCCDFSFNLLFLITFSFLFLFSGKVTH